MCPERDASDRQAIAPIRGVPSPDDVALHPQLHMDGGGRNCGYDIAAAGLYAGREGECARQAASRSERGQLAAHIIRLQITRE